MPETPSSPRVPPTALPDDPRALARLALACLDLTSLQAQEDEAQIDALCARAATPFGPVAALCVWPRWLARVRARRPAGVRLATVANFPEGALDAAALARELPALLEAGAEEIDLVLPWRAWLAGDTAACGRWLAQARRATEGVPLKLILESGALMTQGSPDALCQAATMALDEGVDWLKTSTGKGGWPGATPEAADTLLAAIAGHPARRAVGFKASGGVRSLAQAHAFLGQTAQWLGPAALQPGRLRLGASSLLDELLAVLAPA